MVCTWHQLQTQRQHGRRLMADATHKTRGLAIVSLRMACDAFQQANDELALRLLLDAVKDLRAAGVAEKGWECFETQTPIE